ncbi:MAG: WG repeat-containing protein [Anaeromicrobium sp.]|uniref:WG repeat-containing protein n=1 Tax=Anaeromicrobium sp. TaxID=1929132 RepID=UPI0025FB9975|nr:WG repeat-containing protein [Anaeromicrobium sp.]MCT4592678.1 WG repeat-containing protein [Anaeromicrobium sp.]
MKDEVVKVHVFANPPRQSKDDKIGFLNLEGQEIVEPKYKKNEILSYSEGFIGIKNNEKWGYLDINGKMVIEPKFDEAGWFYGGVAAVKIEDKWYFINEKGEFAF